MPGPKYPLDPLLRVRKDRVDEAARALAEAVRAREQASMRRAVAEDERDQEARRADEVRRAERAALAAGTLRAEDLQRAASWEVGARAEAARLEARVDAARAGEAEAVRHESDARGELAAKQADVEVVEKDRARFAERARRAAEAREQEAAEEAHRPKETGR
jgi:hypothetical protein